MCPWTADKHLNSRIRRLKRVIGIVYVEFKSVFNVYENHNKTQNSSPY